MTSRVASCIVLLALLAPPARAAESADEKELRRIITEMGDAIASGRWAVWDRYLDEQILYAAEDGRVLSRADLQAEFKPLPPGYAGSIVPGDFVFRRHGDVTIVSHLDAEKETIHGQTVQPKYLTTDTWKKKGGRWKLVARQVLAVPGDPPAAPVPAAALAPLAGKYQLAEGVVMTVSVDGDHLVVEREGRPKQTLLPETDTVFFAPGQPRSRKIFVRDAAGRVTHIMDRREGQDLRWTRLDGK